jgi:hypothetical protein
MPCARRDSRCKVVVDVTTPDDLVRGMDNVVRNIRRHSVRTLAPDAAHKPLCGYEHGRART